MTLVEKIKAWIDNFVNNIKKAFERVEANSTEAVILADYQADTENIQRIWDEALKKAVNNNSTLDTIDTDGGVQYSIKKDIDGTKFVEVDANIYDSTNGTSVASVIANIISIRFNNLIKTNGQFIRINSDTNKEYRESNWAKALRKANPDWYMDKIKSIANADEVLKVAKNWINENIKHDRDDNVVSFGRAHIYYRVGNHRYEADVLVAVKDDGSAVLYDLVDIKDKKIVDANSGGESDNTLSSAKTSTNDSISNPNENVKENKKYSLRDNYTSTRSQTLTFQLCGCIIIP